MCGIAGLVDRSGLAPTWRDDLRALDRSLHHRGPDDHGYFTDVKKGEVPYQLDDRTVDDVAPRVAFIHRRLSILDRSAAARQPLVGAGGKVFLTYNGEVYNYRELRSELEGEGVRFRTRSDTEVVLAAYIRWGIGALVRLRGIFAFAIADMQRGRVFLARDHLGVKPLYIARRGTALLFASELKAIADLPGFARAPDPMALRRFLHFLWIPGESTGLAGISKLEPGSYLDIDLATGAERTHRYWSPLRKELTESVTSPGDAEDHLRAELARVVREQMVSDVPLGAFLSGGLDSSLIVSMMRRATPTPPSTYSVGYAPGDLAYDIVPDDLPHARAVAAELGTDSHEILLSPDMASVLPDVVAALDEPIGDPAAVSSFLICRAAKQRLTVMLSGMGADEIFAGYPRQRAMLYGRLYRRAPAWIRSGMTAVVDRLPGAGRGRLARLGRSGKKFLAAVDRSELAHYIEMETYFPESLQREVLDPHGPLAAVENPIHAEIQDLTARVDATSDDPLKRAVLWDLLTYLPSLNLAYTDRTSMAHAVEVRVPFLDIKLVEWALGLRAQQLIRWHRGRLEGKWLLKRAARGVVSDAIIWRKKAGFGAPVRSWLRGGLAEMTGELLGTSGLGGRGWFRPEAIAGMRRDFSSGRSDYALQLWMLISLELWARRFVDGRGVS